MANRDPIYAALHNLAETHCMHGRPEDREQAVELYGKAKGTFTEIGATGYVEIVEGRLEEIVKDRGGFTVASLNDDLQRTRAGEGDSAALPDPPLPA